MPARDIDDLLFLDAARDVYSLIDSGNRMPECFPAALLAATGDLKLACCQLESAEKCCKSPIEKQLMRAMFAAWYDYGNGYALVVLNAGYIGPVDRETGVHESIPRIKISIQHKIDQYTADFAIRVDYPGVKSPVIVVECDGHDYHERTKEQAAHDRARDRHMTTNGYRVMRFTGSQIYQDAAGCVKELQTLVGQLEKEAREKWEASIV